MDSITKESESILQEAERLTHGNRNKDYGHPLDDYTRTAALASALIAHKLTSPITAGEMAMIMICVKLSRQVHSPKRDNMTDAAGYAWVAHACEVETNRLKVQAFEANRPDPIGRKIESYSTPLEQNQSLSVMLGGGKLGATDPTGPVCDPGDQSRSIMTHDGPLLADGPVSVVRSPFPPMVGCDCSECAAKRHEAATGV